MKPKISIPMIKNRLRNTNQVFMALLRNEQMNGEIRAVGVIKNAFLLTKRRRILNDLVMNIMEKLLVRFLSSFQL